MLTRIINCPFKGVYVFGICLLLVVVQMFCATTALGKTNEVLPELKEMSENEFILVDKSRMDKIFAENEVVKVEKEVSYLSGNKIAVSSTDKKLATLNENNIVNCYSKEKHNFSLKIKSTGIVDMVFLKNNDLMIANYRYHIIYIVDNDGNVKEAYNIPMSFYPEDFRYIDRETFEVSQNFFGYKIYLKENAERTELIESGGYLSGVWGIVKYPFFIAVAICLGYLCIKTRKWFWKFFSKTTKSE